ncbi:MAG: hypothetical protein MUQ30_21035 [Anaerolineae bacterium]|nr:hypothetical protein [Anaerolineae bacterium]
MAFVAPFGVGAMVVAANQEWVNALWDIAVEHPADEESYFASTLKLLSVIVMSGNWLEP